MLFHGADDIYYDAMPLRYHFAASRRCFICRHAAPRADILMPRWLPDFRHTLRACSRFSSLSPYAAAATRLRHISLGAAYAAAAAIELRAIAADAIFALLRQIRYFLRYAAA